MTSCHMWGSGMLCLRSCSISPGKTKETQQCWGWLHLCIHRTHWATAQLNQCLLILVIKCPLTPQIYICSYYQWTIHMQLHVSNDIWGLFYYTLKRKNKQKQSKISLIHISILLVYIKINLLPNKLKWRIFCRLILLPLFFFNLVSFSHGFLERENYMPSSSLWMGFYR